MELNESAVCLLLGQALGDAMGFPVEGQGTELCQDYVERHVRGPARGARARRPFQFGQYTDDTQLARELLQSLTAKGEWQPADYAARVAAIFVEERIVGRGRATMNAAQRIHEALKRGEDPCACGEPAPSAGNGSAMRAAVCAIWEPDDPAACAALAKSQGEITHQDPRASAGAIVVAEAARLFMAEGPVIGAAARQSFCEALAKAAEPLDLTLAAALLKMPRMASWPLVAALPIIAPIGKDPNIPEKWEGISPFVTGTVLWSIYCALRSPEDGMEALALAIECGGDVDTTAAITGAFMGAALGVEAFSESLLAQVHDRDSWGAGELAALARKAVALRA